jgi:hypothetical protein
VPQIANLVKSGVENILGLNSATLQMGVHDAFFRDKPLRTGIYVGVGGPANSVRLDELWFRGGNLLKGKTPPVAKPYEDYDYMVLAVEGHPTRDDWRSLPTVVEFEPRFTAVLANSALSLDDKRKELQKIWTPFQQALLSSPYLTEPDQENIADSISKDLGRRLKKLGEPNPVFETRSFGGKEKVMRPAAEFDLLDVADATDRQDPQSVRQARAALTANPFQA